MLAVARKLSARGVAVVFVSHRLAEVLEIASRVTVLRDSALIGVYSTEDLTQSRLTELMTCKTFDQSVSSRDQSVAPVVLSIKGLTRRSEYADISLNIHQDEVLGLTGLIGAGRTEMAHTIFGMTGAESGEIPLSGQPLQMSSNRDAVANGIAYVSKDRLS